MDSTAAQMLPMLAFSIDFGSFRRHILQSIPSVLSKLCTRGKITYEKTYRASSKCILKNSGEF